MPILTTKHGEIAVHCRQITRMADRMWRLGSSKRRAAYVEKARRRLAVGPVRHSDAAIILAVWGENAVEIPPSTEAESSNGQKVSR